MISRALQLSGASLCLMVSALSCCSADVHAAGLVETPNDAATLCIRGWTKPTVPSDAAFRDVAVGLGGAPMGYVVTVTPGASYEIALGFCEGNWDRPGQRLVDIWIDGRHRKTVDTVADTGGPNTPHVVRMRAADDDRDGRITVEIRAAAGSPDANSILNVLWVFEGTRAGRIDSAALIRGELNDEAYVYFPAGRQAIDPRDTRFQVMGRRCVAHLDAVNDVAGAVAFAMTEGLASLKVSLEGAAITGTRLGDDWLERDYRLASGARARSYWYACVDKPAFVVLFDMENTTDKRLRTRLSARLRPNPGYFAKFAPGAGDTAGCKDGVVTITDSAFPQVRVCAGIFPSPNGGRVTGADTSAPGAVRLMMERDIELPPGESAVFCLVITGGDGGDPGYRDAELLARSVGADAKAELSLVKRTAKAWKDETLAVRTPDDRIDRYFDKAKQWAFRDTRVLPFGKPHSLQDGRLNERIPVLTASPMYHGVFANDSIQSIWEWGALGSRLYPVLQNSLDVMLGYGIPESVEWISGDGSIFLSSLKIGQHAEWVTGACYLMLWSGRKEHQTRYWPKVREVLGRFHTELDRDHDYLEDYSSSTFPEHPDPGAYNHEMLYASAFWYKAFEAASTTAGMIGDAACEREYAETALSIRKAINARFGSPWGYAGWLDAQHSRHEHINHNSVLPLQYGIATDRGAKKVLASIFSPESMTEWGPLHMDSRHGILGSQLVWAFQRWNLVHALFETGRADEALDLMRKWISQESGAEILYGAPEAFNPDGRVTSLGYSWTAGRAVRACLFGMYGLRLLPDGFAMKPKMPSSWSHMSLRGLEFRGTLFDIEIRRGDASRLLVDGQEIRGGKVSGGWLDGKRHQVLIECGN